MLLHYLVKRKMQYCSKLCKKGATKLCQKPCQVLTIFEDVLRILGYMNLVGNLTLSNGKTTFKIG